MIAATAAYTSGRVEWFASYNSSSCFNCAVSNLCSRKSAWRSSWAQSNFANAVILGDGNVTTALASEQGANTKTLEKHGYQEAGPVTTKGSRRDGREVSNVSQGFSALAELKSRLLEKAEKAKLLEKAQKDRSRENRSGMHARPTNEEFSKLNTSVSQSAQNGANDTIETHYSPNEGASPSGYNERRVQIRLSNLPRTLKKREFEFMMQRTPGLTSWEFLCSPSGECGGHAKCEAASYWDAQAAVEALGKVTIDGRKINATILRKPQEKYFPPDDKSLPHKETKAAISREEFARYSPEKHSRIPSSGNVYMERKEETDDSYSSPLGKAVLAAMQQTALERTKAKGKTKSKATQRPGKIEEKEEILLQDARPLVFKAEWESQLRELEVRLDALKRLHNST